VRKLLLWLVLGLAATAVAQYLPRFLTSEVAGTVDAEKQSAAPTSAHGRFAALPSRPALGNPAGDPFVPTSWIPRQPASPVAPAQPAAPRATYRVVGKLVQEDDSQIVLAKGNEVFLAHEGDTLEDGYRVEAIRPERVTLVNARTRVRENLPIASTFLLDDLSAEPPSSAASGASAPHHAKPNPARVR
jgi:hypothetical protein